jgi:cytochrome c-L
MHFSLKYRLDSRRFSTGNLSKPRIFSVFGAMSLSAAMLMAAGAETNAPQFASVVDGSPLEIKPLAGETITDAVKAFYANGENPYKSDPAAIADGKKIYLANCQACHMPDGSGRIGPSLIGDTHNYDRFTTDKGIFEIVYGGATGAMQPFGKRLTQDDVLRVTAYVRTLKK